MTAQMIKGFLIVLVISLLGIVGLKILKPSKVPTEKAVVLDKESLVYDEKRGVVSSPVVNSQTDFTDVENRGSVLSLSPTKGTFSVGQPIKVEVDLNTNGEEVMGAEAVIIYDPEMLSVSDQNITAGTLFPSYPIKKLQREGMVRIVGLISDPKGDQFNGKGVLGTINFKATGRGNTAVTIDFVLGATNKSNVVKLGEKESGVNYLKNVVNASYMIN